MKFVLLIGALVAAAILLLRKAAPADWRGTPPAFPTYQTDKKPSAPAGTSARTAFDSINSGGCALAARKVGAGNMAGAGCSAFIEWATPIGYGEKAYDFAKDHGAAAFNSTLGAINPFGAQGIVMGDPNQRYRNYQAPAAPAGPSSYTREGRHA